MRAEPRSSEGLGGVSPAGMTCSPGTEGRTSALSSEAAPTSRWESPGWLGSMSNVLLMVGFLRSPSTRMTSSPDSAMTRARFAETVDFPSACIADVTTRVWSPLSMFVYRRLVRSFRRASSTLWSGASEYRLRVISTERGMVARTGSSTTDATSDWDRMRLSRTSRAKAETYPTTIPLRAPVPTRLAGDGERVAPDRPAEDMRATPMGESAPSRRLICASAWRIVSSAIV